MRVLVTRPANLAAGLVEMINAMGDVAELFPVIEIKKTSQQARLHSAIDILDTQDIAIFISQSAVQFGMPAIQSRWPKEELLPNLLWAAIGSGTARALQNLGIQDVLFPPAPPYESESLVAMPTFQTPQIHGKKISLFRGNGGRELLSETLRSRGALVQIIEVYQRCLPVLDTQMVEKIKHWQHTPFNVMITTSADSLYNLVQLLGNTVDGLTQIPLIVVGARMQKLAKELNFKNLLVATSADDGSIINVLKMFKDTRV
ncbi:MAG TPA: uroporphyrinogen-III synthase [Gammaproteobacteria bacterium]|nr:uroporphyrinogen-III synthase [Gammaproteobacteria bacterium]